MMDKNLRDIFGGVWAIDHAEGHARLGDVMRMLDGHPVAETHHVNVDPAAISYQSVSGKRVAIIGLQGAVTKYGNWCAYGNKDYTAMLAQAEDDESVDAVVMTIDSGGGSVGGLWEVLDQIKAMTKPVVAHVDGIAASAAYAYASQCDEIIASQPDDQVGSIGVFVSFIDYIPMLEKEGAKFHEIYATLSTNKNGEIREALKGNYKPIREDYIDPTMDRFKAYVESGRGEKLQGNDDIWTGKCYMASEALELGLIDHINNLAFAFQRAADLADQRTSQTSNNSFSYMAENKKSVFQLLAERFGAKTGADLKAEEVQELEATIAALTQERDDALAARAALTQERDEALAASQDSITRADEAEANVNELTLKWEAEVAAHTEAKARLQAEEEAHKATKAERDELREAALAAGGSQAPTKVQQDGSDPVGADADSFEEVSKKLKHNQEADKHFKH